MVTRTGFKRALGVTLLILSVLSTAWGETSEKNSTGLPKYCPYCGMSKQMSVDTWMMIDYAGGRHVEVCSIFCGAIELALHNNFTLQQITVADAGTKRQIDAEMAYWVIGGSKKAAMIATPKWAFEDRASAENFIRRYGGRPATFDDVIENTFEEMYLDIRTIQKLRRLEETRKKSQ